LTCRWLSSPSTKVNPASRFSVRPPRRATDVLCKFEQRENLGVVKIPLR
jgi:hypothetical protein